MILFKKFFAKQKPLQNFSRKHPSGANQLLAMAKTGVVPIR
jgi:hypothetical protein